MIETRRQVVPAAFLILSIVGIMFPVSHSLASANDRWLGTWQGQLELGTAKLRLVFGVSRDSAGTFRSTMDSPDQGATGIPVTQTLVSGDTIRFLLPALDGRFEGVLSRGDSAIGGTWRQRGMSFPVTLHKVESAPVVRRPQEPRKPYPYREEEVTFENSVDGVRLAGTLTFPEGRGASPAVILVSGSGPQDRNETVFGHRPFLVIADYLTRRGISVLRYDDRGVGSSTGSAKNATTENFVRDAEAAFRYLVSRNDVDHARIGFLGHSEGGLIVPAVAVRNPDVAYLVLVAGTGLPGEAILLKQAEDIARAAGASEVDIATARRTNTLIYDAVKSEPDTAVLTVKVRRVIRESIPDSARQNDALIESQVQMVTSPWFRYFVSYDPRPALRKVHCPVLALCGELDLQVSAKENLPEIEKALREGNNRDITVLELKGLNHLLQSAATGSISEYAQTEETIAPSALEVIGDWMTERLRRR